MPDHQEVELKLALPEDALAAVMAAPPFDAALAGTTATRLSSVYFDTPKGRLRRHGVTLRVRAAGGRFVQTVKTEGATGSLLARGEWEAEIAGPVPDLAAAQGSALDAVLSAKGGRTLRPVFESQVDRLACTLRTGDAVVELALDHGRLIAAGREEPICELELELKQGDCSALFDLARSLAARVPARLAVRSKSARGYDLLDGRPPQAVSAAPVTLDPQDDAAAAFRTIAGACLHQIAANWEPVRRGDAGGVHAMRVGLRRLRAAISLFRAMLDDGQREAIKTELKWLTGALGPARQYHVFAAETLPALHHDHPDEVAVDALDDDIARRWREALARVRGAIESGRFRALLLDTAAWIEAGAWSTSPAPEPRALRQRPIAALAAEILERRARRIVKRGRRLRALAPERRHKLRIAAKKLRYGSAFFASLFPDKGAQKRHAAFIARLKALQDALGALNDIAAHQALVADVAQQAASPTGRPGAVPYAAGLAAGHEAARIGPLLDAAVKAHRRFARAAPFW